MTRNEIRSFSDSPIQNSDEDKLDITGYVDGLSNFIVSTETPVTIAFQGGWGTGKTSLMTLIDKELKEKHKSISTMHFNTWQYSQFNLEDNIGVSFLSYVVRKLSKSFDKNSEYKRMVTNIFTTLARVSVKVTAPIITDEDLKRFEAGGNLDVADLTEDLKTGISKLVNKSLGLKDGENDNGNRLVIFIDDLDRLNPKVAVNLLEVIKLFLDIKNCIFVIAVDSVVIEDGIKLSKEFSDEKAKEFLDKIIQVPFNIPVESYNYQKFLEENLPFFKNIDKDNKGILMKMIHISVGSNPRAMKRLLNNYSLNYHVNSTQEFNEKERILLIAVICLQLSYQSLYTYMILNEKNTMEILNETYGNIDEFKKELNEYKDYGLYEDDVDKDVNINRYISFISILSDLMRSLYKNKDEYEYDFTEDNIKEFKDLLNKSQMTDTSASTDRDIQNPFKKMTLKEFITEPDGALTVKRNSINFEYNNETIYENYGAKTAFQKTIQYFLDNKPNFIYELKKHKNVGIQSVDRMIFYYLTDDKGSEPETAIVMKYEEEGELKELKLGHKLSAYLSLRSLYYLLKATINNKSEFNEIVESIKLEAREKLT